MPDGLWLGRCTERFGKAVVELVSDLPVLSAKALIGTTFWCYSPSFHSRLIVHHIFCLAEYSPSHLLHNPLQAEHPPHERDEAECDGAGDEEGDGHVVGRRCRIGTARK